MTKFTWYEKEWRWTPWSGVASLFHLSRGLLGGTACPQSAKSTAGQNWKRQDSITADNYIVRIPSTIKPADWTVSECLLVRAVYSCASHVIFWCLFCYFKDYTVYMIVNRAYTLLKNGQNNFQRRCNFDVYDV